MLHEKLLGICPKTMNAINYDNFEITPTLVQVAARMFLSEIFNIVVGTTCTD